MPPEPMLVYGADDYEDVHVDDFDGVRDVCGECSAFFTASTATAETANNATENEEDEPVSPLKNNKSRRVTRWVSLVNEIRF